MELISVKKNPVNILEKMYAVMTLFIMTRPLWKIFVIGGVDIQFFLVVVLYLVPVWFVLIRPGRFAWIVSRDKILLFLVGLAIISLVWSADKSDTIKSATTLLGSTFFGVYLAMRYSLQEQMQVLLWTLILIGFVSLMVIVISPSLGIQTAGKELVWVGVYDHKNGLGRYMAINAVLTWIVIQDSKRKWLLWGNFILAVIMVIMSRSATSLLVLGATIGFLPIFRVWRWRNARWLPGMLITGILLASIAVVLLSDNESAGLDWFYLALGRNPGFNTLQVRLALWKVVLEGALQRPWLGFGYGNTSFYGMMDAFVLGGNLWTAQQAHNGYLEIFMQLGLVGLATMLVHVILGFRRGFWLARMTRSTESLWVLAFLNILLLFNLTYSAYLGQLTAPWTIYVALTYSVCYQLDIRKDISDNSSFEEQNLKNSGQIDEMQVG